MGIKYAKSGVSIDSANIAKKNILSIMRNSASKSAPVKIGETFGKSGFFGGMFALKDLASYKNPVLVGSVDGVGTKLRVAQMMNKHNTVGIDIVNHCINDILACGARGLFFMDYLAVGRLKPKVVVEVVKGVAKACRETGIALLGGETAEMPGFYQDKDYDLAGTIIGIVDREDIITGETIEQGDLLLGLPSTGLHTNGYSLARKVLFEEAKYTVNRKLKILGGKTIGEILLQPHKSYADNILKILSKHKGLIKGMAHITGGGFSGNIPRALPKGLNVRVCTNAWNVPSIFNLIQEKGNISKEEMYEVFNMGIGYVCIISPKNQNKIFDNFGKDVNIIGEVVKGNRFELV